MTDAFFDSNVFLYVLTNDAVKAARAEALVAAGGLISVQVLNECTVVLKRKFGATWEQISKASRAMRESCDVVAVTEEVHERGLSYAEQYQLQIYDGMMVAAAVLSGCKIMYSENMHDGLVIDGLTIRNPFAAA